MTNSVRSMPARPDRHAPRSRRLALCGAALAATGALLLGACSSDSSSRAATGTTVQPLPAEAEAVVDSPTYEFGQWNWYANDLDSGATVYANNEHTLSSLASTTKLFTVGTYLDQVGTDATVETPVYATGNRSGTSLQGDLVLVGAGDFILGSRNVLSGALQFMSPDHVYAYASPTVKPVEADPLAGLDSLAAQVVKSGITTVNGDVLVDDRLWTPFETKEGVVTPIMVNDNLLDMGVRPGAAPGDPATIGVRPQTAYFDVVNQVVTTAAGGEASVTAELGAGNRIVVSGEIPVGAEVQNLATFAPDPAAYARALFVEALRRAGVAVNTPLTASIGNLPAEGAYDSAGKVASLTSPPASELSKLVLKTSHNRGAETLLCLLAVKAGSKDCMAGMPTVLATIGKSGVDSREVFIYDGEGSNPASGTPGALVHWLTWADQQSWSAAYRAGLPDLSKDGTVIAKSGTAAQPQNPPMPSLFLVSGEAGYIQTASGRRLAVAFYATNGSYPTVADGLAEGGPAVTKVLTQIQQAN